MNIICCDNFASVVLCLLALKCNLAYNCIIFVNQCVDSLAQFAMMFPDSYELLSKIHVTRQVGSDLVNMLYAHLYTQTQSFHDNHIVSKQYLFIYCVHSVAEYVPGCWLTSLFEPSHTPY